MKDQYFADQRDFVKFDLLIELAENSSGIRKLTNIPMLTPADQTGQGNVMTYEQGQRRVALFRFLRKCLTENDRKLKNLRSYFQGWTHTYCPYKDDEFFLHKDRDLYFRSIPDEMLTDAVVFFDPDTGLEHSSQGYMRRRGFEQYVFWADIANVFVRSTGSVLVIYQHLQRNAKLVVQDVQGKARTLGESLSASSVTALDDGDVAYLVTCTNQAQAPGLNEFLSGYAQRHGLRHHIISAGPE